MLNIAIGLCVVTVISFILNVLLGMKAWLAVPIGVAAGMGVFIYLGKMVQGKLEVIMKQASEQWKRQQWDAGVETMKKGYKWGHWQLMVRSTIDGQIGTLQYIRNKHAEAEPLLKKASFQHFVAKAMLAVMQWRRGERVLAKKTMDLALKAGKKESLLYALYAYLLNDGNDRGAAIEMINRGLKYCKDDDRLLTNRTQLQNKKPMKMKVYGEQWYQFMLERPVIRQEPPPFAKISKRALRG